jgi:Rnl2 family RNA ligase
MEFKKYSSIENSYREKIISQIREIFPLNEEWIVTEKIHGANFSFITDGIEVKCAKRSGIIGENENFYNYKIVYDKYKDEVLKIFNHIKNDIKDVAEIYEIQIFGELFGGYHPNLENKYKPIQKGVYYTNDIEFMAFDMRIRFKLLINDKEFDEFYEPIKFYDILSKFNLPIVDILFKGKLEECLEYSNEFNSTICKKLGLPEIEDNICEGVVIKPYNRNHYLPSGDRVILKNKNDKFKEKGKIKKSNKKVVLTDVQKTWTNELSRYFKVSRLENLLSKGEVKLDWKQFGKIVGLFFKDALEDFIKDNPNYEELPKTERKIIQKEAQSIAANFVREFMKKHI